MLVSDSEQRLFYDAGVGTKADPTAQWPVRRFLRKKLDAAIGQSIRANVLEGWPFPVAYYEPRCHLFIWF